MSSLALTFLTPCRRCVNKFRAGSQFVYFLTGSVCQSASPFIVRSWQVSCRGYSIRNPYKVTIRTRSTKADSEPRPINISEAECKESHTVTPAVGSVLGPTFQDKPPTKEKNDKPPKQPWIKPEGYDTGILMYNSLTKKKEPLILPNGRVATWYACGPTVYDHAHIGHASSYLRIDLIRRILKNYFGIDVVMMMGITDIDDKIIHRSQELQTDFRKLALHYEADFFQDMEHLRILPATLTSRVTEHVPHIVRFIQRIMDNGHAYRTPDGSVYFDVTSYGRYGRLVPQTGTTDGREPLNSYKRHPRDFALWKASKENEPWWESPWGRGRPGWHIECSTMASAMFGEKLDVHSGGDDLKFPHHENEIAQSEACFCSQQWTNYWLHTGSLHQKQDQAKMSKSLKNTISVKALLKSYTANHFRVFCMMVPYRYSIEYGLDQMKVAKSVYGVFSSFLSSSQAYLKGQVQCQPINEALLLTSLEETKQKVERALRDDFDTARAMAAVQDLIRRANVEMNPDKPGVGGPRSPGVMAALLVFVERFMENMGLHQPKIKDSGLKVGESTFDEMVSSVVKFRDNVRNFALTPTNLLCASSTEGEYRKPTKQEKQEQRQRLRPLFDSCDQIRKDLHKAGIVIEDLREGSKWRIQEEASLSTATTPQQQPTQSTDNKSVADKNPK